MTDSIDALRTLNDTVSRLVDAVDEVYPSDQAAADMLGVGLKHFRTHYRPYCGLKEGAAKTYRKSELLARRAQLRREGVA